MVDKPLKSQALARLNGALLDAKDIVFVKDKDDPSWRGLKNTIRITVANIFGDPSPQMKDFQSVVKGVELYEDSNYWGEHAVQQIVSLMNQFISEVTQYWTDDVPHPKEQSGQSGKNIPTISNKVFIVHGHNHGVLNTVSRFIEKLGLEAIILQEQARRGNTIIEMLEKHSEVSYAIVILSPDDLGAAVLEKDHLNYRARQNVILELGFFIGKLGRKNTSAIVVEEIEIPSDYHGILYIKFDTGNAWKLALAKELREAGFMFDANKVF